MSHFSVAQVSDAVSQVQASPEVKLALEQRLRAMLLNQDPGEPFTNDDLDALVRGFPELHQELTRACGG